MKKKLLVSAGVAVGFGLAAFLGALIHADRVVDEIYDVPLPPIERAATPEGLARGEYIFRSICWECHRGAEIDRAVGQPLTDWPAFVGRGHSANLTADRVAGIGAMSDRELARVLRYGVLRDGRVSAAMNSFRGIGDDDVAAVIAFMRSDSELFTADPTVAPKTEFTVLGKIVVAFMAGMSFDAPASGLEVPAKAVTREYGEYMANRIFHCDGCHTPGFETDKSNRPDLYGGGFAYEQPDGRTLYSANITFDETGIGAWSLADFSRALRHGLRPDSAILRRPMPLFPLMDDVDAEAVFLYLRSLPPVKKAFEDLPADRARPEDGPEQLFVSLGCIGCHGPGAQFEAKLRGAVGKRDEEIASWIRNPQEVRPGSQMPTYAELIDENRALGLARWVKDRARRTH